MGRRRRRRGRPSPTSRPWPSSAGSATAPTARSRAAPSGRPIETGELDPARLKSFEKLQAELAYEHRKEDPRAAIENKKLWATRHKAARAWMKQKRGGPDDG